MVNILTTILQLALVEVIASRLEKSDHGDLIELERSEEGVERCSTDTVIKYFNLLAKLACEFGKEIPRTGMLVTAYRALDEEKGCAISNLSTSRAKAQYYQYEGEKTHYLTTYAWRRALRSKWSPCLQIMRLKTS